MATVQVPLDVPDEIWAGLRAGDYVRMGGVVRDMSGRLVKLLDDASPNRHEPKRVQNLAGHLRPRSRKTLVLLGVVAATATAGTVAVASARRGRRAAAKVTSAMALYNASLARYLEAARDGQLQAGIIETLIDHLNVLGEHVAAGRVALDPSWAPSEALLGLVAEHTKRLAEANGWSLHDLERERRRTGSGPVADLLWYLAMQATIFTSD